MGKRKRKLDLNRLNELYIKTKKRQVRPKYIDDAHGKGEQKRKNLSMLKDL